MPHKPLALPCNAGCIWLYAAESGRWDGVGRARSSFCTVRRLVVLPLAVLALAGCAGEGGDAGADPATALPPSGVYFELVVNPEGEQRKAMTALAGKLLRTGEPGRRIVELLESENGDTDFERDVKPWLGRRAAIALTGPGEGEEASWTAAAAASDAGKAADAIERLAEREDAKAGSHAGVDYWVDEDGEAIGVAGDFVLFGASEAALRQAIDVRDGKSLAETERFGKAVEPLPEGRAGTIFFDLVTLLEQAPGLGGAQRGIATFLLSGFPPTAVAVLAEADLLAIETRADAREAGSLTALMTGYVGATPVLGELPGDSWAAVGMPEFATTARQAVSGLAGPFGGAFLDGQLEADLGISLERDLYSWMGDVGVFVRGQAVPDLGGGIVAEVTEPARARAAMPRLLGALRLRAGVETRPVALEGATLAFELRIPDVPAPVYAALAHERMVIAYGRSAALAALQPSSRLVDGDAFQRAAGVLDGLDPVLVLDAPAALRLAERAAAGDPDFASAKPYLETISIIAGGSRRDGDRVRSRLAAGVR